MKTEETYTKQIRSLSGKYYPAWFPEMQFKLGDYGFLKGCLFVYQGNVADHLGIPIKAIPGTADATHQWSTSGSTTATLTPQATLAGTPAVKVNARLDVGFSSVNAMFFSAAGCLSERISDVTALQDSLIKMMHDRKWRQNWVVVTELIRSQATIALVSGGATAKVTLEADANVPKIDLANVGIKLGITSERAIGHKTVAYHELTPLMELRGIATGRWWHPESPILTTKGIPPVGAIKVAAGASEGTPKLVRL